MTNTSPPPVDAEPRNDIFDLGRLRRTHERHVAGVAGGLARHLDVDPIIIRVAFVVLVFFGGSGLLLYGAVWLLAPEEGSDAQPLGLDDRNRNIALIGAGVLAAIAAVGDFAGAFWFPWPLVIVGLLVVWFLNRKNKPKAPRAPKAPQTWTTQQTAVPGAEVPVQQYSYTYVKPRNPRKNGPILFWFTLALIATGIGTLGLIDVSGADVPDAAYPGLAMSLTGVMLLLGAFWGRAGGLILIGLIAAVATLGATATDNFDGKQVTYAPTTSAEVHDSYELGAGKLTLDLSEVEDVDGLDGRELEIDSGVGQVDVIVPDGMDVVVDANVGVGDASVFGQHNDGLDVSQEGSLNGGINVPEMRIYIDHGVGQVTVREQ